VLVADRVDARSRPYLCVAMFCAMCVDRVNVIITSHLSKRHTTFVMGGGVYFVVKFFKDFPILMCPLYMWFTNEISPSKDTIF
jgi:hypothetical protein